jgi:DNA-binding HxlR family transcriptional regulator
MIPVNTSQRITKDTLRIDKKSTQMRFGDFVVMPQRMLDYAFRIQSHYDLTDTAIKSFLYFIYEHLTYDVLTRIKGHSIFSKYGLAIPSTYLKGKNLEAGFKELCEKGVLHRSTYKSGSHCRSYKITEDQSEFEALCSLVEFDTLHIININPKARRYKADSSKLTNLQNEAVKGLQFGEVDIDAGIEFVNDQLEILTGTHATSRDAIRFNNAILSMAYFVSFSADGAFRPYFTTGESGSRIYSNFPDASACRGLKYMLFPSSKYTNYDLQSTNVTALFVYALDICPEYCQPDDVLYQLVTNKQATYAKLTDKLTISKEQLKEAIIAIINGASTDEKGWYTPTEKEDSQGIILTSLGWILQSPRIIRQLVQELYVVIKARDAVITHLRKEGAKKRYTNLAGNTLDAAIAKSNSKLMSHYLCGVEARIILYLCTPKAMLSGGYRAISYQFDGIVVEGEITPEFFQESLKEIQLDRYTRLPAVPHAEYFKLLEKPFEPEAIITVDTERTGLRTHTTKKTVFDLMREHTEGQDLTRLDEDVKGSHECDRTSNEPVGHNQTASEPIEMMVEVKRLEDMTMEEYEEDVLKNDILMPGMLYYDDVHSLYGDYWIHYYKGIRTRSGAIHYELRHEWLINDSDASESTLDTVQETSAESPGMPEPEPLLVYYYEDDPDFIPY